MIIQQKCSSKFHVSPLLKENLNQPQREKYILNWQAIIVNMQIFEVRRKRETSLSS